MTIPRVEGWWESIAKPLEQIGTAVADWKNPFRHTQKAVMQKLAMDPSYAQELSQLAKDNPELVNRMGLSQLVGTLSGTAPSPERQRQETALRRELRAENREIDMDEAEAALFKGDPALRVDATRKRLGLGTMKEEEALNLSIEGQKLQQSLNRVQLLVQNNALSQQLGEQEADAAVGNFIKKIPSGTNFFALASSKDGIPDNIREAIFKSPTAMRRWESDKDTYFREQGLKLDKLRLEAQKNSSRMTIDEYFQRRVASTSEQLSESLRMNINDVYELVKTGTPLSSYVKMYQESGIQSAAQLEQLRQQDPAKAKAIEFGMRYNQLDVAARNKQLGLARRELNSAFVQLQNAQRDQQQNGTQFNFQNSVAAYNDAVNNYNLLLSPGEPQYEQVIIKEKGSLFWKSEGAERKMKRNELQTTTSIPQSLPKQTQNPQAQDPITNGYNAAKQALPGLTPEEYVRRTKAANPTWSSQLDEWLKKGGK